MILFSKISLLDPYNPCFLEKDGFLQSLEIFSFFSVGCTDQILHKELDALTYRVLAYLLLGVVRIYSKKVDFLFDDCNKALIGIKEFVAKEKDRESTNVPLTASTECFSIALPESFELDAFDLGVLEDFHGGNVKPQEDITLKDGGQEAENMDQYYMERFDMGEVFMYTSNETFLADHNNTKDESFAHDMDIDTEIVRDTTEEASVRVVEAEPLDSNESSRDHQNASRHREDPESDDMLVELQKFEDIRRAQEEETDRETISTIVQRLVDLHEPSGDNLHRDGHRENSESEKTTVETSREKMLHDQSLPSECNSPEAIHGAEEQPSGASRLDREKEIPEMSPLVEPEPGSVSEMRDLPEGVEKRRGHSDGEMTNSEMLHGSHKEPFETSEVNQVGLHRGTEKCFLSDMSFSEDGCKGFNAKETPVTGTPKTPSRLRISEGETSHQYSIIPTPAAKESARVSRKRKCLIDDEVIIPNKVMKKIIGDPSDLITKRRKVPHTDYSDRRIKRLADPSKDIWNPLIPYGSSELQLLFSKPIKLREPNTTETPKAAKTTRRVKDSSVGPVRSHRNVFSPEQTENAQEIMETPQAAALTELKITVPETVGGNTEVLAETGSSSVAAGIAHQTETPVKPAEPAEIAPETPARTSEHTWIAPETPVVSERVEIAPETPVRESTSKRYFKDPETCDKETRHASSFASFDEHRSEICEDRRDLDAILMNEEVNADGTEDLQQESWSVRTRNVAKFLEKTFQEQSQKGEEEKASLLQLCRGRTQKESARLFYETLVLKTKGYLEVKQDHPYSDVLLTRYTRQQAAC